MKNTVLFNINHLTLSSQQRQDFRVDMSPGGAVLFSRRQGRQGLVFLQLAFCLCRCGSTGLQFRQVKRIPFKTVEGVFDAQE